VSVVVSARREEENVRTLADRVRQTLARFTECFEVIFVCDGYEDETRGLVRELHAADARMKLVHLSRSFGHQNALLAGLDHASGRVVITMDGDLQHPPETIADLLIKWEQGYDVVHAVRRSTRQANLLTRKSRGLAYNALRRLCEVDIVPQSAEFRLYDDSAVRAMRKLREQGRFNRGLSSWIGFRHAAVYYDECPRTNGQAEYSLAKRLLLLMNGIFSLSSKPLQYLGVVGLSISLLAAAYLAIILLGWAIGADGYRVVAGWSSTVAIVLFVGGIQLTGLWLMGQYLARTYDQVKGRPCYIVADALGLSSAAPSADAQRPRILPRRRAEARAAAQSVLAWDDVSHNSSTEEQSRPECPVPCSTEQSPRENESRSVEQQLHTYDHA
jgi:dolichol-phosphate mannosyltransferase